VLVFLGAAVDVAVLLVFLGAAVDVAVLLVSLGAAVDVAVLLVFLGVAVDVAVPVVVLGVTAGVAVLVVLAGVAVRVAVLVFVGPWLGGVGDPECPWPPTDQTTRTRTNDANCAAATAPSRLPLELIATPRAHGHGAFLEIAVRPVVARWSADVQVTYCPSLPCWSLPC
jgi:hypothetical protein